MKLLLLLLLGIVSVTVTESFLSRVKSHRVTKIYADNKSNNIEEKQFLRQLLKYPSSQYRTIDIISAIQDASSKILELGQAISVVTTLRGSRFLFESSPNSYLDIIAETGVSNGIDAISLNSHLVIKSNKSLMPLLQLSSSSLIDSVVDQMESISLSIPNSDDVPDSATEVSDTPTSNHKPTMEAIYTWKSSSNSISIAIDFIVDWSKKFAGKGIGIVSTINSSNDGVTLRFTSVSDTSYLKFSVVVIGDDLVVDATLCANDHGDDGVLSNSLVKNAAANIITSLKKDLDGILINPNDDVATVDDDDDDDDDVSLTEDGLGDVPSTPASATATANVPTRKRDPELLKRSKDVGVRVDRFEGRGLEEQSMKQLQDMINNSKKNGYLASIKSSEVSVNENGEESTNLQELFEKGKQISSQSWQQLLNRTASDQEDLSKDPLQLPINLKLGGLAGGIDIFQDPKAYRGDDDAAISSTAVSNVVFNKEKFEMGTVPVDETTVDENTRSLKLLVTELNRSPDEMHATILDSFRDLLLSDNFLYLMRTANETVSDPASRASLRKVVDTSVRLTSELGILVITESVKHLETIHDICEISAKYQDNEVLFLEKLDYIKPRFDTELVAYLNYAIAEEQDIIVRKGSDPFRFPSQWLQILQVIQKGVLAEFEVRYERLIEPILLTLRFDQSDIRSQLLEQFIATIPAIDLYVFRSLAYNMITSMTSMSDVDLSNYDHQLKEKLLQLKADVDVLLSDDIIEAKVEHVKEAALLQGKELQLRNRNPIKQAIQDGLQDDGDGYIGRSILDKKKAKVVQNDSNGYDSDNNAAVRSLLDL